MPNCMEATLESIRSAVNLADQREVFLDQLPRLQMPTLIVWEIEDRVIPYRYATAASLASKKVPSNSSLAVATCPTSSNKNASYRSSTSFLGACSSHGGGMPLFTELPKARL